MRAGSADLLDRLRRSPPGRFFARYDCAQCALYATVIAYNALFSIFPITLAIVYFTSIFLGSPDSLATISATLGQFMPLDALAEIKLVLAATRTGAGLVGLIGLLTLLWAGSGLFGALAEAFNHIYGVPNRPFVRERIMSVGMIFVFGILLLASVGMSTVAQVLVQLTSLLPADVRGSVILASGSSFLLSFISALALFLVIYYVIPNVQLRLGDIWLGALLGAALFVLLAQVFPLYVRLFGQFERYGAFFGFAFLLLTWLWFIAQVFLIGAIINAMRTGYPRPRVT